MCLQVNSEEHDSVVDGATWSRNIPADILDKIEGGKFVPVESVTVWIDPLDATQEFTGVHVFFQYDYWTLMSVSHWGTFCAEYLMWLVLTVEALGKHSQCSAYCKKVEFKRSLNGCVSFGGYTCLSKVSLHSPLQQPSTAPVYSVRHWEDVHMKPVSATGKNCVFPRKTVAWVCNLFYNVYYYVGKLAHWLSVYGPNGDFAKRWWKFPAEGSTSCCLQPSLWSL